MKIINLINLECTGKYIFDLAVVTIVLIEI